ncbi:AMP-binding protein [Bradyrhizobium pachyrhizi]|uniref:AMP-binding protein n=1 Tax=Bradyrhizobium pachyrhizi TaxID=280333 RepID=A0A844SFL7_9BRAD|nr:AMP-binding protein [Bradyrhizobium pachyrhizi]MVT64527.1 AMP-binding protein [Bradyrhizobium pachyrhizi]
MRLVAAWDRPKPLVELARNGLGEGRQVAETIFEAFRASTAAAPDNAFICVPAGTSYAPDGIELTYQDVMQRVAALTECYRHAGYGLGHRVALLVENRPDYFLHLLALNAVGASVVPVNPDHRHAELLYQMQHSGVVLAVALPHHIERLRAVADELAGQFVVLSVNGSPERLSSPVRPAAAGTLDRRTEAGIFYTSGTTGRPKGCLTTNDYWLSAGEWFFTLAKSGGRFSIAPGKDRLFNPMPVFHVHAGVVALMPMLLSQGCVIRPEYFSAKRWWNEVSTSRATIVHYIGAVPQALVALDSSPHERAHSVRFGFGAGMEPAIHREFEERFGIPHLEVWGMTEVGRWTANDQDPRPIGVRAIGRALGPLEARVVGEHNSDVAAGAEGELVVRLAGENPRKGFFAGYLDDEAATEAGWSGGWWHSGDIVRQDEDGIIYFVDRRKNMIRRSGENIAATEVETVLCRHPAVDQIAILPVPDEKAGEEIFACVVPAPSRTADTQLAHDIANYCKEQLAYYKAPGWILFLDRMPVTATQKINKAQIFAPGLDPRTLAGVIDLRRTKKRN